MRAVWITKKFNERALLTPLRLLIVEVVRVQLLYNCTGGMSTQGIQSLAAVQAWLQYCALPVICAVVMILISILGTHNQPANAVL